jgi:hypothetical protein
VLDTSSRNSASASAEIAAAFAPSAIIVFLVINVFFGLFFNFSAPQ